MRTVRKLARLAAVLLAGAFLALTLPASAATTAPAAPATRSASAGCSDLSSQGVTCGSQELATMPLMLAAPNKAVAGANLEVKASSSSNPAEDWESLQPPNQPVTGSTTLVWSPGGVQSDLCAARSGMWVVLADCDPADWSEQIVTLESPGQLPGYRMQFRGTNLVIAGPNHDAPYRVLVAIPVDGKAGQNWTFAG